MSWKFLTFSVFFTDIFLLFLMFYLGYDFETFKKVALAETLLVIIALIFDSMEQKKKPIFPGCIVANSNMRCDSLKSLMIINKLSKFL